MGGIFISYRRSDSQDVTGRIYDALIERFSDTSVFKDVDSIPAGTDFRQALERAVTKADVVVVVIGPRWLTAATKAGLRRLDDPEDFVRIEVELALKLGKSIVPITVSNAAMVSALDLAKPIQALAFQNGLPVRPDPDFRRDVSRLVATLERLAPRAQLAPCRVRCGRESLLARHGF